jgi:hypothetical protein
MKTSCRHLKVLLPGAGMVRLGGEEVAPCDQFVALDGSIVVDRPAVVAKVFGALVDTKWKTALPRWHGILC